ncbi:MAG: aminoglycoside phosphotransferase family protein [Ruminococcaceae bacterium]|nr:aminoglycoside phosphotransferase family protein [Oscillospiraceae bacterium]
MEKILRAFLPHGDLASLAPLGEGIINTTFSVRDEDGKRYVLQKVNTNVFPDPFAVMDNTVSVTDWMRKRLAEEGKCSDRCVPLFLQTTEGGYLYQGEDGGYWRCSRLIEGATAHIHVTDPKLLYHAGKGYGEFVRLTDGFPASSLAEVLPNFHNTKKRFEAFLEAVERDAAGRAREVDREIQYLKEREELAGSIVAMLESGELPLRVTHNDTKLSNVLLDDETGEAVCVIDLDTVMPGTVLYDFGDAIRSGAASAAEDEPKLDRMNFVSENCKAFKEGFVEACGGILIPAEVDNLMLGARVIVYEQAMRFLTDYLNGDTYYKTLFPGHNLIRARTQIRLFSQIPE